MLGLTLLAGCEGPKATPAAFVPPPPMPDVRHFPVKLSQATAPIDSAPKTSEAGEDLVKVVTDSQAKSLNTLIMSNDGKTSLSLSGPTYSGEPFQWSDYRGKVVLVLFWASWDPTSREDLSNLEKVKEFYRYRPLEVVAVNLDRDITAAKKFLAVADPTFPVIMDGEQGFDLASDYPTRTVPLTVVVNKSGKIEAATISDPSTFKRIEELLREKYTGPVAKAGKPKKTTASSGSSRKSTAKTTASKKSSGTAKSKGADDGTLVEAKTGAGKKGRGYGGDIYTEPLKALWSTKEKLVFDVEIPKAMSLFQATKDRYPESHAEFMKEIIEEGSIQLPELPAGQEYVYLPEKGKLMIRQPATK